MGLFKEIFFGKKEDECIDLISAPATNIDCMFDGLEFLTPMRGAFPDAILKSVDESYSTLEKTLDESMNIKQNNNGKV
jgi:hypothetical protein